MAYKLAISEPKLNLTFWVKYENLSKYERPEVEAKAPDGTLVKERTTYQGQVLGPGATNRQWVDDKGNIYQKSQLKFYFNGEEVQENTQTKVFQIVGYQPIKNYTDSYVISKYYELYPHDNDMKKDFDRETARITNLSAMKKLWDYLHDNNLVGRGEFSASSKGFTVGDAYLRAIEIDQKWGIELGIFVESKVFEHLNENKVIAVPVQTQAKRLKMV